MNSLRKNIEQLCSLFTFVKQSCLKTLQLSHQLIAPKISVRGYYTESFTKGSRTDITEPYYGVHKLRIRKLYVRAWFNQSVRSHDPPPDFWLRIGETVVSIHNLNTPLYVNGFQMC